MRHWLTIIFAVALAFLVSFCVHLSNDVAHEEGYRAGLQVGTKLKEAEMLRSFDEVRQVAVDSLGRELACRFGQDFGRDPFDHRAADCARGGAIFPGDCPSATDLDLAQAIGDQARLAPGGRLERLW